MTEKRELIIVNDLASVSRFITHINTYHILAYDIETTGLKPTLEKVIGFSISGKVGEAYYFPHLTWDSKSNSLVEVHSFQETRKYIQMLTKKELLMWNGSFDIRFTNWFFGINLTEALIADIMLMKHTLEEDGFLALKKSAIQYQKEIGLPVEEEANKEQLALKENVAKNGGSTTQANYEMYKADLEVMGVYAAADADLTLRLALLLRERLETENLVDFFYDEVMQLYKLVTIKMETMPVKLDIALIEDSREKITLDIDRLENEIMDELISYDTVYDWIKYKANEKFPAKPTGSFAQKVVEFYGIPLPKSSSGKYSITKKSLDVLKDDYGYINSVAFLLTGDVGYIGDHVEDMQVDLWEASNDGKVINISSKNQMGEMCFNYLGVKALSKTKKGTEQFNDDMIQHLADQGYSWASKLSDYNKLLKIRSAYMDRFLENQIDGHYYFYYKQAGTISGRFSSDAQQLPRPKEEGELSELVLHYNNLVRAFFISGEGRVFCDLDYESLEPHVFSHVSGDEGLRNIFRNGDDFYSTIAIKTEKLEGVSADKKAPNYLGKVNKPLRQSAKAYSLGIPYGMSPYALAKTLGVSEEEAQRLYDGYLDGFPELKKWMERSKKDAQLKGYVTTQTGRVRHLNRVKEIHAKHGEKILDFKYKNELINKIAKKKGKEEAKKIVQDMYMDYKNGINNARNFQIQGLSASIVNRAMIEIMKRFSSDSIDGWVCATIHDQIIVNISEKDVDKAKIIVEDCMVNTVKLSVDLKAPPAVSTNWRDGH
jgi:DNA polymerase I-like protein with 3'-5' exonuclease and polymerase domains